MNNREPLYQESYVRRSSAEYSPQFLIAFWGIALTGLLLRWFNLDARPIHHDESLHIMYSVYFFDWPDTGFYKYDPMLHGPLLYNFFSLVFHTLGISAASARAPIALIGSLMIFTPWIFRRHLSTTALLGLTAAIALSPTLAYWSRFLREDYFVILGFLFTFYGIIQAQDKHKAFFVAIGLALQFCSKESTYVHLAIFLGYLLTEHVVDLIILKENDSLLRRFYRFARSQPWTLALGFLLFAFIYVYLYTAGFRYFGKSDDTFLERYFGVILDAFYRESILYWFHQNAIERIKGPFIFHWHVLGWYELPFVLACITYLGLLLRQGGRLIQISYLFLSVVILSFYLYHLRTPIEEVALWRLLKLKLSSDVPGAIIQFGLAPVVTLHHLLRRERMLALWGYLFFAFAFSYCYLGEKVPWLTMYPFVFGLIYLTLYFDAYFHEKPVDNYHRTPWWKVLSSIGIVLLLLSLIFALEEETLQRSTISTAVAAILFCGIAWATYRLELFGRVNLCILLLSAFSLYSLRASILTNFVYPGSASEFISQVHTTQEFHNVVSRIRHEIVSRTKGYRARVLALGEPTWPLGAYMVHVPEYKFSKSPNEPQDFDYIFEDYTEAPTPALEGYHREKITLRGWWIPDYESMTLKRFLHYSINHHPWSPVGYSYCYFSTRVSPSKD